MELRNYINKQNFVQHRESKIFFKIVKLNLRNIKAYNLEETFPALYKALTDDGIHDVSPQHLQRVVHFVNQGLLV